jgi:Zn-dependent protease/predicted transcriptional regulator
MKWAWKLGTFAGIGVYVHATFSILIAWVVLGRWLETRNVPETLASVAFVLSLFACVVLHEFGHALTARRYGIRTRDITLLPIGGLARLEKMPDRPIEEFWVALAGPAVNVVIAAALFAALSVTGGLQPLDSAGLLEGTFLNRLMLVNVSLVLFNLLPAFPMDGGRVLRALLAMRMEYARATRVAASVGQGMALLFGFLGFFTNPFLLFIALFVWIGAEQEAAFAQLKVSLGGIPVERAMLTDFRALSPRDSLHDAVNAILAGSQHDFPVVEDGYVQGLLTRADLLKALALRQLSEVGEAMQRDFPTAHPDEPLENAFQRLQESRGATMPVLRNGRLVGMLTSENIGEFLMIQAALGGEREPALARSLST